MADLSADAPLRIWNGQSRTEHWTLDNSGAQTIYKGQPMFLDTSGDTVYLLGFLASQTVSTTDIFIGIAAEGATVATADTETDNEIEVYVNETILGFASTVFTDADVGDTVYMSDSATLSATSLANPQIGKLHRVYEGYAYVQLVTPYITAGAGS